MKLFHCQSCSQVLYFENERCLSCEREVGYLPSENRMIALEGEGEWRKVAGEPEHGALRFCHNHRFGTCNWLVTEPEAQFCEACVHNRVVPDLSDPAQHAAWAKIEAAKHRLFYSMIRLDLPRPVRDHKEPLIFDFPADQPGQTEKVMTGHDSGLVTIALAEADDAHREQMRSDLGEDYRTLLGHFRHEIGHYYWNLLVRDGGHLESFRALFGDDREDYGEALQRHYDNGSPEGWEESYVSSYATMHAWEDWAETWAHYLHIVDTLETAAALGLQTQSGSAPPDPYTAPISELLNAWIPLTVALNTLARSMGHRDSYPFTLPPPVREKLGYVHDLLHKPEAIARPN